MRRRRDGPGHDRGATQLTRILFVCLGNICRSPTAEGVMRGLVREQGRDDEIEVESAGTGDWHIGDPPDARATEAAARRGVTLAGASRQIRPADFADFDLIVAMDRRNLRDLCALAPDDAAVAKVRLLRSYDPASAGAELDVPDPFYGESRGFETVLDNVEAACRGLLAQL
ncbi:MAG TPA: low molecular weight protein-tyrosine-phosphatase [Miltoncostaeaceae bacterium]|nr:low molecular weight protein-tyrosine-phosphatase [Miltoncostaeaceae bacterium]